MRLNQFTSKLKTADFDGVDDELEAQISKTVARNRQLATKLQLGYQSLSQLRAQRSPEFVSELDRALGLTNE